MNQPNRNNGRRVLDTPHFWANVLVVLIGIVAYMALSHLSDLINLVRQVIQILGPFIGALVMAWLLDPIVRFWESRVFTRGRARLRRGLSVALTYLLMFTLIGAMLYVILPQVYDSLLLLLERVPTYLSGLGDAMEELSGNFALLDTDEASVLMDAYRGIITRLTEWVQSILPQIVNAGVSIGNGIVNVLMAIIASIYMQVDKDRLRAAVKRCVKALLPAPYDARAIGLIRQCDRIFAGFIDGKLLDSLIIGCLCFIGTLILRIPFAGLISLIIGVTNIIPFFGPIIGAVPCVLILLLVEPWSALWFLIFVIALQQLDGNVIGPRILGDSTGVSALGVLVSISVGSALGGVAGMLLGVPVYAILTVLVREYLDTRLARRGEGAQLWPDGSVQMSMTDVDAGAQPDRPAPERPDSLLTRLRARLRRAGKGKKTDDVTPTPLPAEDAGVWQKQPTQQAADADGSQHEAEEADG